MKKTTPHERRFALIKSCQLISGNRAENVLVRADKLQEQVFHRVQLEVAASMLLFSVNASHQPLPEGEDVAGAEMLRRKMQFESALTALESVLFQSLGPIANSADGVPPPTPGG